MSIVLRAMVGLMLMIGTASGWAAQAQPQLAAMTCAALDQAVTSQPAGPVLVASYPPLDGQPAPILALRGVAFTYVNVKKDAAQLARMLEVSKGRRAVPVIVDDQGRVTIGFGGT